MGNFDLIIGIHSILCALKNKSREIYRLVGTEEIIDEIKKTADLSEIQVDMYASHKVQEEAKKYFRDLELEYHRVPSGVFLIASALDLLDVKELYRTVSLASQKNEKLKILCLDQVTDVHNAAAIVRTANFYGIDYIVTPDKKSFGLTPSFFRIASGAAEYIKIVGVSKLPKTIAKLKELGVECLALSEHAKGKLTTEILLDGGSLCLILGREDVGISNAVLRLVENHIALESFGETKSLNVSIAAAITMEKCFGKK